MAGSYFTKPKGLHPTPSACYPPPPPPAKGGKIAEVWFNPPVITMAGQIKTNVKNLQPDGTPEGSANVKLFMPGYYDGFELRLAPQEHQELLQYPFDAPKSLIITAEFRFDNGQRRTVYAALQINP